MNRSTNELRAGLESARQDFHDTLEQARAKLESERQLASEIMRTPVIEILLSASLGFLVGRSSRATAPLVALIAGAGLGYVLRGEIEGLRPRNER
jgi:hypothetical protein